MRVIAGKYRHLTLVAPKGLLTRPTMDRVKEAMFSILSSKIPGAIVLDLFAGSGALGIEALSRGAKYIQFNDMSNIAIKCIEENLKTIQANQEDYRITSYPYKRALSEYNLNHNTFDLIFIDPPYAEEIYQDIIDLIKEYKLLNQNGKIIIESDYRKQLQISGLGITRTYKYGDTMLIVASID